jgi:hypothetical protein
MDVIQHCLALAPVPGLAPAFYVFKSIWMAVEQVHVCQEQLISLAQSTAQLLEVLNEQFRSGRISESQNDIQLTKLYKLSDSRSTSLPTTHRRKGCCKRSRDLPRPKTTRAS